VNLTDEQNAFVEGIVSSGRYQNASEAIRDAIRGMQHRLETEDLQLEALRHQVKLGLDALGQGAFTDVDDADLDEALDRLVDSGSR
jgi:antitoxin ParD1/3/4